MDGVPVHAGFVSFIQFFGEDGSHKKLDALQAKEFGKMVPENEKKAAFQAVLQYNKSLKTHLEESGQDASILVDPAFYNIDSVTTTGITPTDFHAGLKKKKKECELLAVYESKPHYRNNTQTVFCLTHLIKVTD